MLVLTCGILFSAPSLAGSLGGIYKWTDASGKVHYSDIPPSQMQVQSLKGVSAGQEETTAQATRSLDEKNQAYQKRRDESEQARAKSEKEAEQARIKRENCDKARRNLSNLQDSPRPYTTSPSGQHSYMDDAARTQSMVNSQKAVSEYCK
jgi:hypothetical protein